MKAGPPTGRGRKRRPAGRPVVLAAEGEAFRPEVFPTGRPNPFCLTLNLFDDESSWVLSLLLQQTPSTQQGTVIMKSSNEGTHRTASKTVEVVQASRQIKEDQNKEKPPTFSEEFFSKKKKKTGRTNGPTRRHLIGRLERHLQGHFLQAAETRMIFCNCRCVPVL